MKCAHCRVEFHDNPKFLFIAEDTDGGWGSISLKCPSCNRQNIFLVGGGNYQIAPPQKVVGFGKITYRALVRPKSSLRPPVPFEVPNELSEDYNDACLVLNDSPKASAALSRRCLQHLLRAVGGIKPSDLANEIQQVLESGRLPSHLSESIDAIRNIGNFSAHPMKSTSTGEILPVEPHEAEWNLDVLEALFDFYFVQPELIKKKRASLNKKLSEAGKPPLK